MLVLSRKRDEQIVINNDIVVTVVDIRGDKVRLGIEAAKNIPVHRREVFEAIKRREAAEAAEASGASGGAGRTEQPKENGEGAIDGTDRKCGGGSGSCGCG